MKRRFFQILLVPIAMLCTLAFGPASRVSAQDYGQADQNQGGTATEAPGQPGVENLTRGPIHEAFAEVVAYNPQPGVIVSKQPPDPVDEVAPDQKPEDENAVWIPGYWDWDQDRNDFIWVSGVWRVPPPGCQWVPGYWNQVENGYQRISGFWWCGEEGQQNEQGNYQQVSYLPTPPESLESGPSSPQPAEDQFWVPGCWIWRDVKYVWRPGYWAPIQQDWVWIAARYIWTPSGCVFIEGHWDYTLTRRGLCFAPAYFQPAVYAQPTFRFVPTVVINIQIIQYNLFCWPRYNQYYFGDYYGPQYVQMGIVPWFDLYHSRIGYEPFYVYDRWYYVHRRHEPDWTKRVHETYEYRVKHEDARPPHTYAEMRRMLRGPEGRQNESLAVAVSLDRIAREKNFPVRLAPVNQQDRERMSSLRKDVRDFARERDRREAELRGKQHGKLERPEQLRLTTSPISPARLQAAERAQQPEPGRPKPPTGPEKPSISGKGPPSGPPKPGPEGRQGRGPEGRGPEGRGPEGREGRPMPGKPEQPQGTERQRGARGPETPPPSPKGPGAGERPESRRGPGKPEGAPGGEQPERRGRFEQPGGEQPQGPGQQEQRGGRGQQPGGPSQFEQPGGRGRQPQGPGQQEQPGGRGQQPGFRGGRENERGPGQQQRNFRPSESGQFGPEQQPGQFGQPGGGREQSPQGPGQQEQRGGRERQPGFPGQRDNERGPGQQRNNRQPEAGMFGPEQQFGQPGGQEQQPGFPGQSGNERGPGQQYRSFRQPGMDQFGQPGGQERQPGFPGQSGNERGPGQQRSFRQPGMDQFGPGQQPNQFGNPGFGTPGQSERRQQPDFQQRQFGSPDRSGGFGQPGFGSPDRSPGGEQPRNFERFGSPEGRGGRDIQRGGPDSRDFRGGGDGRGNRDK